MSKPANTKPAAIRLDDAGVELPRRKNGQFDRRASGLRQSPQRHVTLAELHAGDPRWRPDVNPKTGGLWARFRGQGRRGRVVPAVDDDLDLRLAINELTEARAQLAAAYRIEEPRERRPAVRAALGKIALAGRLLDDLVMRRSGEACDRFANEER